MGIVSAVVLGCDFGRFSTVTDVRGGPPTMLTAVHLKAVTHSRCACWATGLAAPVRSIP
jgi:hypothetical protein